MMTAPRPRYHVERPRLPPSGGTPDRHGHHRPTEHAGSLRRAPPPAVRGLSRSSSSGRRTWVRRIRVAGPSARRPHRRGGRPHLAARSAPRRHPARRPDRHADRHRDARCTATSRTSSRASACRRSCSRSAGWRSSGWPSLAAIRLEPRSIVTVDRSLTRLGAILIVGHAGPDRAVPGLRGRRSRAEGHRVGPQRHDHGPEARRLLAHLRPLRVRPLARDALRHRERPDVVAPRPGLRRSSPTATRTTSARRSRSSTTLNATHLEDISGLPSPESSDLEPVVRPHPRFARGAPVQGARLPLLSTSARGGTGTRDDPSADVNLNVAGTSDFVDELYRRERHSRRS